MGKSLREYIPALLHWWWILAIGTAGSIIGVILNVWQDLTVPIWVWIGILLLSLFIAQLMTFHKVRVRRDKLQSQLDFVPQNGVKVLKQPPTLYININDIAFGLSGNPNYQGYPPPNAREQKTRWIRLGILFEGNVFIETLELVISGKEPISAFEWKPGQSAYYHYFQIPAWVKPSEERTIQVQAFANGVKYGSPEKSINVPTL